MNIFILIAALVALIPFAWSHMHSRQYDHRYYEMGQKEFSISFLQSLNKQETGNGGNLFFSSYSIHRALTMTYFGADNKTRYELERVLDFKYKETGEIMKNYFLNKVEFKRRQQDNGYKPVDKMFIQTGTLLE